MQNLCKSELSLLKQSFQLFHHFCSETIVQKATLTDEDFARASELETYLDEVPDYLALDFSEEYSRLKLELMNRE